MYIAKRAGLVGGWDYFQDRVGDSPKWTKDKKRARRFADDETAMSESNVTGLYEIIIEEV
jgi:hypothetical protein